MEIDAQCATKRPYNIAFDRAKRSGTTNRNRIRLSGAIKSLNIKLCFAARLDTA